jgi:hypothetical protein
LPALRVGHERVGHELSFRSMASRRHARASSQS